MRNRSATLRIDEIPDVLSKRARFDQESIVAVVGVVFGYLYVYAGFTERPILVVLLCGRKEYV